MDNIVKGKVSVNRLLKAGMIAIMLVMPVHAMAAESETAPAPVVTFESHKDDILSSSVHGSLLSSIIENIKAQEAASVLVVRLESLRDDLLSGTAHGSLLSSIVESIKAQEAAAVETVAEEPEAVELETVEPEIVEPETVEPEVAEVVETEVSEPVAVKAAAVPRIQVLAAGDYSFQFVRFADGEDMNSRFAFGAKAAVVVNFTDFIGLCAGANIQRINYEGFDYREVAALLKARFAVRFDRLAIVAGLGGGVNFSRIAMTTGHYPMVSMDLGVEFIASRHIALTALAEYSVSFQRTSVNNHLGLFVGLSIGMGGKV